MRTVDFPPVPVGHRFRPPVRPRRSCPARGRGKLSPLQHRTARRRQLPDSVALAGFWPDEVALTVEQNVLTPRRPQERKGGKFLYRGISARNFKRQFTLADHVEVKGAGFENGLLVIDLQREIPEAKKPRRIAIAAPQQRHQIESKAA